jgi:hypothetical protein
MVLTKFGKPKRITVLIRISVANRDRISALAYRDGFKTMSQILDELVEKALGVQKQNEQNSATRVAPVNKS